MHYTSDLSAFLAESSVNIALTAPRWALAQARLG
jgi:hypothetical protein